MLYDIIYDFLLNNFFSSNNTSLSNYSTSFFNTTITLDVWLSHTFTIITLALLFIVAVLIIKWLFKVFAGLIIIH